MAILRTVKGEEVSAVGLTRVGDLLHVVVEPTNGVSAHIPLGMFSCNREFVDFMEEHYDKDNLRNGRRPHTS